MDGTAFALQSWCRAVSELYKSVDCEASYRWTYPTKNPYSKSVHRSKNKARLRQQALEAALTASADYLLVSSAMEQVISRATHLHCVFTRHWTWIVSLSIQRLFVS